MEKPVAFLGLVCPPGFGNYTGIWQRCVYIEIKNQIVRGELSGVYDLWGGKVSITGIWEG